MSLETPVVYQGNHTIRKLQRSLHVKAKSEPNYRFYSLWDKVCRWDVLKAAYAKCRRNGGAAGVDGETFEDIEKQGLKEWLGKLEERLRTKEYRPQPLLRVWIEKANKKEARPLGVPTIRDRVAQAAVCLVIEPIFEADLAWNQYGFRPGRDAKRALRRVYHLIAKDGRTEVIDADLSNYFDTIPHGPLMKSVSRRISDGQVLSVIKRWLQVPVVERKGKTDIRTTGAKDKNRGTPQGGVISPLLANIYFRRFILAWHKLGYLRKWKAYIVNYADDFVICADPGNGEHIMRAMRRIIEKMGLTINESKTKIVKLPEGQFDFLGYTHGRFYGKDGRSFIYAKPSKKSVRKLMEKIREETISKWYPTPAQERVVKINRIVRGWVNYFNEGFAFSTYAAIQKHMEKRLRRWLVKKHGLRTHSMYYRFPNEYIYDELGLYKLPTNLTELARTRA